MYLYGLYHIKPKNVVYFPDFGKYWAKINQFLPKMGPGTLKCENWDFTFVETSFGRNVLWR